VLVPPNRKNTRLGQPEHAVTKLDQWPGAGMTQKKGEHICSRVNVSVFIVLSRPISPSKEGI